jgi:hypothetical protein
VSDHFSCGLDVALPYTCLAVNEKHGQSGFSSYGLWSSAIELTCCDSEQCLLRNSGAAGLHSDSVSAVEARSY